MVTALLEDLARRGLTLAEDGGRLRVRGPASAAGPDVRQALAEHKDALLALLRSEPPEPVVAEDAAPTLSAGQLRLWLLDVLAGRDGLCNVAMGIRLTGPLDLASLERALTEIVARHEVLRTRFVVSGEHPEPRIAPPEPIALPRVDLRGLPPLVRHAEAERLTAVQAQARFSLEHDLLVRTSVLVLDDDVHLLLVTTHHLIADGWSMGIFVQELAALYGAFSAGRRSPLPPVRTRFAEVARAEHQRIANTDRGAAVARWRARLDGAGDLDLPSDHPRPRVPSYRGETVSFSVPPEVVGALDALARSAHTTLFVTLLAAYAVWLQRHGRSADFAIGTMVALREDRRLRDVMGFLVDIRPVRCDLRDDPTFEAFVARLHPVVREVLADHEPPFDGIATDLGPRFRTTFVFENTPVAPQETGGLRWDIELQNPDGGIAGTAKADIGLSMVRAGDGLRGAFEVATDGLDPATIARFGPRFGRLLTAIARSPETPVSALELIPDDEVALQASFLARAPQVEPAGSCVPALIAAQAARTPDAVAVVFDGTSLDYRTLDADADRLARHLLTRGVGPGVAVGIYAERSLEMVTGLLAVLKTGAAYVPIDPHFPRDRVAWMLEDSGAAVVLTHSHLRPDLVFAAVDAIDLDASVPDQPGTLVPPGPDDLAYVIYTSGSTGRPKGVEVLHRSVVNLLSSLANSPGLGPDDTVVAVTSLSFDTAVADLWWPLSRGARVVVAARDVASDGHRLADLLLRSCATLLQATPATWRLLLDARWQNPLRLRILSTGEALAPSLAAELLPLTDQLWNLYGPTETTVWSSLGIVRSAEPPILLGQPVAHTRLYVLDDRDRPVPIGVPGALCIGGSGLARGYLGRPDLTAERFVADPFVPGGRMYRTGDVVRYRNDGGLEYLGRSDHQVKIRGFRIELGEIEAVLATHPDVRAAVVVARSDRLAAYAVRRADTATVGELRTHLEATLPRYMVPDVFVLLDALPIGPTGKLDRNALPAPETSTTAVPPSTPQERALATLWADLLQLPVDAVGAHDDFFALGGHSLLATRLVSRIREQLGAALSVRDLFQNPTVAALAVQLGDTNAPIQAPLLPTPRDGGPLPASFAQQRLWFLDQLDPGSAAYHMPAALRLVGPLDPDRLQRVFEAIVDRHESLRTRLVATGGTPFQIVDPPGPRPLPVHDLSHLADPEPEIVRRATEEARTPFDLARGPLFRTTLLRVADQHHVLLVTLHHAIADGWSIRVLVDEIAALSDGRRSLPPLAVQYADYARWQRDRLAGEALEAHLAWWRRHLAAVPVLDLPTDRPRPPVQSDAGDRVPVVLSPELTRQLHQLARDNGATLFMVLLAGFFLLLARWSGQRDFCVGTPVAGRDALALEPLIGFLVNTLVLRADLSGDPSFLTLLARVRDTTLDAREHDEIPFDLLVDTLRPARDRSRSPLFQVLFSYQAEPLAPLRLPGVALTAVGLPFGSTKFDLALELVEDDGRVTGALEFATALFDRQTADRMSHQLEQLLRSAVETPAAGIDTLSMLTAEDRARLASHSPVYEEGEL